MSKVIRGQARVVRKPVIDAHQRAAELVARADEKAKRIVDDAKRRTSALEAEAQARGRTEGYAEVAVLLERAHAAKATAIAEAHKAVTALAIKAAERLLRSQLSLEPERVRYVVDDLVERAARASRLALRVHPDDAQHVQALERDVEVIQDAELDRGECVLETDLGDLDARFSVQLNALEQALRGADD